MNLGAEAVSETIQQIQNDRVKTTKQPSKEMKMAPKLNPENCKINWNESLDTIYNHIRGLNPFPAAWSEIQNGDDRISVKIYGVRKEKLNHTNEIGSILPTKKEIKIAVQDGYILIDELKLSGKRKTDAKSLLNGFTFSSNAKIL